MAGETNSTLPVSSDKPDLHGYPSDPALHISCFVDITLPDRCPHPILGCNARCSQNTPVFSSQDTLRAMVCLMGLCLSRSQPHPSHPPLLICGCAEDIWPQGIPLGHGACWMPKETPYRVGYDPNGKPQKSLEHTWFLVSSGITQGGWGRRAWICFSLMKENSGRA